MTQRQDAPRLDEPAESPAPGHTRGRWRWLRPVLLGLGCALVLVGLVGLLVPGLPGTVFLILAAACFSRSSPRFERWLLAHPRLGPPVVEWRRRGAIPRSAKAAAAASLAVSAALVTMSDAPGLAKATALVGMAAAALYVLTRPH
jgi:uncharacterized protein